MEAAPGLIGTIYILFDNIKIKAFIARTFINSNV